MIKLKNQDIVYKDREIFEAIRKRINDKTTQSEEQLSNVNIFGTLGEKTLHKMVKYYLEPDEKYHEVKTEDYIADIFKDNSVIEIQSANFSAAKDKIKRYLENKELKVIFVYPVAAVRHQCWIDKETGEASKTTRSQKFTDIYKFYDEIYHIKDFMDNENFNLKILLLEVLEYKYLDGWGKFKKNNATKIDKIPLSYIGEENFNCKNDYLKLIPSKLREEGTFTSAELTKETDMKDKPMRSFIKVMKDAGLIAEVGRKNRYIRYNTL